MRDETADRTRRCQTPRAPLPHVERTEQQSTGVSDDQCQMGKTSAEISLNTSTHKLGSVGSTRMITYGHMGIVTRKRDRAHTLVVAVAASGGLCVRG
jgi:hypothetical protein